MFQFKKCVNKISLWTNTIDYLSGCQLHEIVFPGDHQQIAIIVWNMYVMLIIEM